VRLPTAIGEVEFVLDIEGFLLQLSSLEFLPDPLLVLRGKFREADFDLPVDRSHRDLVTVRRDEQAIGDDVALRVVEVAWF
jgi:hypothetical protein